MMDRTRKIRLISNSFYNAGLERAKRRDLTGAVEYLKKCLNLNKYHIDARNLLGLIYYEMGEVSEALVQWVISMNFKEQDNRADYYLDQIQRKQDRLDQASATIQKYNQALLQAQTGSDDLATLQLTRVVEANPRFVKAHLLLALLHISHEDYTKAGKSLYKVLKIDKNNPKANWYMEIVKEHTGKADIERRKLKNAFSHRQMQDDDVIMPPTYKENTGLQSVLNIGAGLLLGAAVIFFLVMPAKIKQANNAHTQEMLQYNEQLNQKNEEIDSLNESIETSKKDKEEAENKLDTMLNSNDSVLNQYAKLVKMLQAYRNNNLAEAVTYYEGFDPSLFTDETARFHCQRGKAGHRDKRLPDAGGSGIHDVVGRPYGGSTGRLPDLFGDPSGKPEGYLQHGYDLPGTGRDRQGGRNVYADCDPVCGFRAGGQGKTAAR